MAERNTGCGIASLIAIGLLSLFTIGAWAYRARHLTSIVRTRWPAQDSGEAYALIDHTAPWSDPWSKLCLVGADTNAERWCRSVPMGETIREIATQSGVTLVRLGGALWLLDPLDGGTIATSTFGASEGTSRYARVGSLLIVAWPTRPPTLRAIELRDGTSPWSLPLPADASVQTLRARDDGAVIDIDGHAARIDPATGVITR